MAKNIKYIGKLSKALSSVFISDAVYYVLTALFSIAYGRLLGKSALGLFSFAFVIAGMIRTIMDAGYELEIARKIGRDSSYVPTAIEQAQMTKNFMWAVLTPIGVIAGFSRIGSWEFVLLLAWNYFVSLSATYRAAFRGLNQMGQLAKVEAISAIALYSVNFILLFYLPNLWFIFLIYIIIELFKTRWYNSLLGRIVTPINYFGLLKIKLSIHGKSIISHIKKQMGLIGVSLLSILQYRISFLALSAIGTPADMGSYTSSRSFITMLRIIPGTFLNTLLPEFSRRKSQSKNSNLIIISFMALLIGLIISFLLWLMAGPLMMLTYKFTEAIPVLQVMAWTFLPLMMHITWESYLLSLNLEKLINRSLIVSVSFMGTAALVLSYIYGPIGAAYAVLGGESLLAVIYAITIVLNRKRFYN